MNRLFRHSKGQMMVLYAGVIAILLGATALCTDVAVMYMNHIQVQKGVDSAAIAGANYLAGIAFTGTATGCTSQSDDAKKAACTYASKNGLAVDDASLTITEPTSTTITVTAQRTSLPYYFGKVIGLSTYNVSATSTGRASQSAGKVTHGMFPVGLQCTSPCSLTSMDPGQSVSFGTKFVGGLAPGNWQYVVVDATGDSALGSAVQDGTLNSYKIGDAMTSEPGNKGNSSNVRVGLSDRLASCASVSDPCANSGNPHDIPAGDPCLVIVPAVDYHGCNGSCPITIEGFALIYLEQNSTGTSIQGCFVQAVAANTITIPTAPSLGADMPPTLIN